jgi:hypothetical protein
MIIPPVGGLGGGLSVSAAEGLAQGSQTSGGTQAAGGEGFGSELTDAISSLEKTRRRSPRARSLTPRAPSSPSRTRRWR